MKFIKMNEALKYQYNCCVVHFKIPTPTQMCRKSRE